MEKAVTIRGEGKFFANIDLLVKVNLPNLYKSFLEEIMTYILRESTTRVPVDTGFLRASGRMKVYKANKYGASGFIGYHAPYAIYVHEILTNRHPVGEAKYLENSITALTPFFFQQLERRIKNAFSRKYFGSLRADRMKK